MADSISTIKEESAKRIGDLYDDLCEKQELEHVDSLTELARHMYDEKLKGAYYHQTKDVISKHMSVVACGYKSRLECEAKAKKCILEAYTEGRALFSPISRKSVSGDAADFYGERITKYFKPFMGNLKVVAMQRNKAGVYEAVEELILNAEKNLKAIYDEELSANRDYYELYKMSYFVDKVEVEKQEYLVTDEGTFGRLIERAFGQNVDYSFNGHIEALDELRKDVVEHADSFYNTAGYEYRNYAEDIEKLISELGAGLPDFLEGESVTSYLARISAVAEECA